LRLCGQRRRLIGLQIGFIGAQTRRGGGVFCRIQTRIKLLGGLMTATGRRCQRERQQLVIHGFSLKYWL
jgi:hypothetical protein